MRRAACKALTLAARARAVEQRDACAQLAERVAQADADVRAMHGMSAKLQAADLARAVALAKEQAEARCAHVWGRVCSLCASYSS